MAAVDALTLKTCIRELCTDEAIATLKVKDLRLRMEGYLNMEQGSLFAQEREIAQMIKDHLGSISTEEIEDEDVMMSENEGEATDDEDEEAAGVRARGACGQFVWPCPRIYPSDLNVRRSKNQLKPEDVPKSDVADLFKKALKKQNKLHLLVALHIFDEPHKRINAKTGKRERHYHIVFKMEQPFAHQKVAQDRVHANTRCPPNSY